MRVKSFQKVKISEATTLLEVILEGFDLLKNINENLEYIASIFSSCFN